MTEATTDPSRQKGGKTVPLPSPMPGDLLQKNALSIGLVGPLERFSTGIPTMANHIELAQQADRLGFAAYWLRDVPLYDPNFGDAGTLFDPWVYLGFLAAATSRIVLGTAAVVLPLRHPLHTAKAAASVACLSEGRLILGVASGDRPIEYPAFGSDFEHRGETFRENVSSIRRYWREGFPEITTALGPLRSVDVLPKPLVSPPMIVVGSSRQSPEWIAVEGDGWFTYPRRPDDLGALIREWRGFTPRFKPFLTGVSFDLSDKADTPPTPIRFGFACGRNYAISHLETLRALGVNHCAISFQSSYRPIAEVLEELAEFVLPQFQSANGR